MSEIRIYFEGDPVLREGFSAFFDEAIRAGRERGIKVLPIAAKGKPASDYRKGLRSHPDALNLLLLDSEGPHTNTTAHERGVAEFPQNRVYWMVQLMETWFVADPDNFAECMGGCFRRDALPPNPEIEAIPKQDIENGIKRAMRDCKGPYQKTTHPPKILKRIRPGIVREKSQHCDRLFNDLLAMISHGR